MLVCFHWTRCLMGEQDVLSIVKSCYQLSYILIYGQELSLLLMLFGLQNQFCRVLVLSVVLKKSHIEKYKRPSVKIKLCLLTFFLHEVITEQHFFFPPSMLFSFKEYQGIFKCFCTHIERQRERERLGKERKCLNHNICFSGNSSVFFSDKVT